MSVRLLFVVVCWLFGVCLGLFVYCFGIARRLFGGACGGVWLLVGG